VGGRRSGRLGDHVDARQAVEPDDLDQPLDVRLGVADDDLAARVADAPREHREVEHERRVREREIAEIHAELVAAGEDRAGEIATTPTLRRTILIPRDSQQEALFVKLDDGPKPIQRDANLSAYTRGMATVDDVEAALTNVIDPELGLDFVELGLIYGIEVNGEDVHVTFTLTTPACPIGPQVSEQIEEFVGELDGVEEVTSSMVFTPPWSPDKMSEDAKFALGY
jgi:metal-sulfur cluster biosynthetic enzyme